MSFKDPLKMREDKDAQFGALALLKAALQRFGRNPPKEPQLKLHTANMCREPVNPDFTRAPL